MDIFAVRDRFVSLYLHINVTVFVFRWSCVNCIKHLSCNAKVTRVVICIPVSYFCVRSFELRHCPPLRRVPRSKALNKRIDWKFENSCLPKLGRGSTFSPTLFWTSAATRISFDSAAGLRGLGNDLYLDKILSISYLLPANTYIFGAFFAISFASFSSPTRFWRRFLGVMCVDDTNREWDFVYIHVVTFVDRGGCSAFAEAL